MKGKVALSLLTFALLVGAALKYTRSVSSSPSYRRTSARRAAPAAYNLILPFVTTLTVDGADDTAAAAACTAAPNDCSLQGDGNGRVYTITFGVFDASGNVGTATATVAVPHSRNGSAAVGDVPRYAVLGGCP